MYRPARARLIPTFIQLGSAKNRSPDVAVVSKTRHFSSSSLAVLTCDRRTTTASTVAAGRAAGDAAGAGARGRALAGSTGFCREVLALIH